MSDEHPMGRQAIDSMTGRLIAHEQRLREQAQSEGADRTPRSSAELEQVAKNTARRYDSKYGASRR